MRKKIVAVIKYLIFLGIGISLMVWQFSKMTPAQNVQFHDSLRHANYIVLIPIVILAILSHLSRAVRWKIIIEPLGYKPSTSNTFYATMCGYFANTFIPRAGEILRCTLLGRYEKIPTNKLIGTILVERIFDLLCYVILVILTIIFQFGKVSDFVETKVLQISNKNAQLPWLKILPIAAVFILLLFILGKWILKKYAGHRHIIRLRGLHMGLKEGIASILRLKRRRAFLLQSAFIWFLYVSQIYVGFNALSATAGLGWGAAFSVLSLATLAIIVAPGGIGAFPVAVQQVLLIYSIDNISFGWLMWGTTTAIIIIVGLISFGLLIYSNKKQNERKQQN
jgi:uncharacterized protein (TIRG00374 family)